MLNTEPVAQVDPIVVITQAIKSGQVPHGEQTAARKEQIILFIRKYNAEVGVPPTLREIAVGIGISENTYATVGQWVNELIEEGFLYKVVQRPRSLKPTARPPRRHYYTLPKNGA